MLRGTEIKHAVTSDSNYEKRAMLFEIHYFSFLTFHFDVNVDSQEVAKNSAEIPVLFTQFLLHD